MYNYISYKTNGVITYPSKLKHVRGHQEISSPCQLRFGTDSPIALLTNVSQ